MTERDYYIPAHGEFQMECRNCVHWDTETGPAGGLDLGGNGICCITADPDSEVAVMAAVPQVPAALITAPTFFCKSYTPTEAAQAALANPRDN